MATQKGRNWSSGDIVTAANLSSIERGVSAVAEEYTPTTWANGNTVTAAGLNNIEQGIVNAGSGSSDFSTVQVTVAIAGDYIYIPCVFDEGGEAGIASTGITESGTYSVPIYKGLLVGSIDSTRTVNVSGNAEYDQGSHTIIITGDCTITISGPPGGQVE